MRFYRETMSGVNFPELPNDSRWKQMKGNQMSITGIILDHVFIAWLIVLVATPAWIDYKTSKERKGK